MMKCKYCWSEKYSKNGFAHGLQRYKCKSCQRNFTTQTPAGYSMEMRLRALKMYLEGLGFRSIGRILNVSNVTVFNWIHSFAKNFPQKDEVWMAENLRCIPVIQIDEFWHYVKKKR